MTKIEKEEFVTEMNVEFEISNQDTWIILSRLEEKGVLL